MKWAELQKFYKKSISEFGPVPKGVGWKDKESSDLRYHQLCRIFLESDIEKGIDVADFGCGYGSLLRYLKDNKIKVKRYMGYDICPEMIEQAKEIFPERKNCFSVSGKPHLSDYLIASGTFTVRLDISNDVWESHIENTLIKLFANIRKGIAFNMLSTYVDWKSKEAFYGSPEYFFNFCKINLSRFVTLIHDYPLFEWTILVRKEGV